MDKQPHIFETNKTFGTYGEFQYCTLELPLKELLNINNIKHWKSNSLFTNYSTPQFSLFLAHFKQIFNNAYLPNLTQGFDEFGVNYYTPNQTLEIYNKIKNCLDFPDKFILLNWLKVATENHNGFYFLGN